MYETGLGAAGIGELDPAMDGIFGDIVGFVGKAVSVVAKPALTVVGGVAGSIVPGAGTAVGAAIGSWVGGQVSGAFSGGGGQGGAAPAPSGGTYVPRKPVYRPQAVYRSPPPKPAARPVVRTTALVRRPATTVAKPPMTTGKKVAIAAGGVGALGLVALGLAFL